MRILLADDHALLRDALRRAAEDIVPSVTLIEATNLEEALELADREAPLDLALLDIRMPGMNGTQGVKTFHERFPDVRVAILSGYFVASDAVEALENGAVGFIPKSLGLEKVFEAMQMIVAGHSYVPPDILLAARQGEAEQTGIRADVPGSPRAHGLTPREQQVLGCLMDGYQNKEIARRMGIQEITVKLHLRSIYRKLNVRNRTQAVRIALQRGWATNADI